MPSKYPDATRDGQFATPRRKRRYIDADVLQATREIFTSSPDFGPRHIWDELNTRAARGEIAGTVPTLRSIQRLVSEWTPLEDTDPWRLEHADGADAALILPVLRAVIARTQGRVLSLTIGEAKWIVRLREAAPDIPPWAAYQLARMYLTNKAAGLDTDALDRIIAAAPWGNPHQYRRAQPGIPQVSPWLLAQLTDQEDARNG